MLKQIESSTSIKITMTSGLNIAVKLKHKLKAADIVIQFVLPLGNGAALREWSVACPANYGGLECANAGSTEPACTPSSTCPCKLATFFFASCRTIPRRLPPELKFSRRSSILGENCSLSVVVVHSSRSSINL